MLKNSLALCLATAIVATASSAQGVHIVDETGATGSFVAIQPAIDAAAPGDLVLVKSGAYGDFTIDGKSISVVEDRGETVIVGTVTIQNLGADSPVVLSGLRIPAPPFLGSGDARLSALDNDGHVLLQDLRTGPGFAYSYYLVDIRDSSAVTLVDCDFGEAGAGIEVQASDVRLHGCSAEGSNGGDGRGSFPPGPGQPALVVHDGATALVADCDLTGGRGGVGIFPAPGGPAIHLGFPPVFPFPVPSAPSDLVQFDNVLASGPGGGASIEIQDGAVDSPSAAARTLTADAAVRAGETLTLSFGGQPNDLLWLLVDVETTSTIPLFVEFLGSFHTGPTPILFRKLADLDATGQRSIDITLSPLGIPYVATWHQALTFNAVEGFVLSNPRFVALLDGIP